MPTRKKIFILGGIVASVIAVVCLLFIPAPYKLIGSLVGYLGVLMASLNYQKTSKQIYARIKELDASHQYKEVVNYVSQVKPLGYGGFVIDSYLLYAYYELGDFKAYEETVLNMRGTRTWNRPKFADFRNKVMDNVACMALIKEMADHGTVNYAGKNLMMMQAVAHYKDGNKEAITQLMNDYPKLPKLKKACMYILSGNFEALEGYYESEIAVNVINEIKGRYKNG